MTSKHNIGNKNNNILQQLPYLNILNQLIGQF